MKSEVSTLKNIAVASLFYQYVYRNSDTKSYGDISRACSEIEDFLARSENFIYESEPLPTRQTIRNFLKRRHIKNPRHTEMIAAFLEDRGYLNRNCYDHLEKTESGIGSLLKPQKIGGTSIQLDGIYVFEAYAHSEAMIAYILGKPNVNGTVGFTLVERVYRRNALNNDQGLIFQARLDGGDPDETYEWIGFVFSFGGFARAQLHFFSKNSAQTERMRYGYFEKTTNREELQQGHSLTLDEDRVARVYVNYTQPIEDKKKTVINLKERLKNNIINRGRFYQNPKQHKELMEPVFFEEHDVNFSELDFEFLEAADAADTVEMARKIIAGADVNVYDPETGRTALHMVTRSLSPYAACMMSVKSLTSFQDYDKVAAELYEFLAQELGEPIEAIVYAVKSAQQRVNPLILDRDHEFAASESEFNARLIPHMKNELDDPIFDTRRDIHNIIGTLTFSRLREAGIHPTIHDMELHDRLAILQDYRTQQSADPIPPSM